LSLGDRQGGESAGERGARVWGISTSITLREPGKQGGGGEDLNEA